MFKSGFVSIIGRPNVGKSSLMDAILDSHIAITSPTAQTTRNQIKGIYTTDDIQIIFIDTPGIHKPKNELGSFMNKQSYRSLKDSDLILWIVDGSEEFGGGDSFMVNVLREVNTPIILVINKIDKVDIKSNTYLKNKELFSNSLEFRKIIEISAVEVINLDSLLLGIKDELEEGPCYYDQDQITDVPVKFIASEIIREKIFLFTKQEIPHSVAVDIESMKDIDDETVEINATIYVDRVSQRKIILGKAGQMIKRIRLSSRKDIRILVGKTVILELWVKVEKGWRDNKNSLKRLGYK